MDIRVIKYYSGELSKAEQRELLSEADDNPSLRSQLVEAGHINALAAMMPQPADADEGNASYRRFAAGQAQRRRSAIARALLRYAAVALVCIVATWAATHYADTMPERRATAQTLVVPAGQRAHITLPDGSRVWVNAGSKLSYPSVFGCERRVAIQGEALFEVAKDARHPFVVSRGKMDVLVLGTRFSVSYYRDNPLSVALLEGSVMAYMPGREAGAYRLRPQQQLVETAGGYAIRPLDDDPSIWCDGIYSFRNQRLADVFRQLELYYDVDIVVRRREILAERCTAKFRQRDGIMEVLRILSKMTPFEIQHEDSSRTIVLR